MARPNILTISPGAPFLATFARALCRGEIVQGLSAADPLALAKTTIYVPTRRAARALAQELAQALKSDAALLPRIRPLGGLEEAERGLIFADLAQSLALAQPIGDIERKMILTGLVLKWGQALKHAIVRMGPDGTAQTDPLEAMQVATHFAGAWHLAGDLAGLIDEMIIEDVAWQTLDDLGANFDDYWRITLNFLNIAMSAWPGILASRDKVDPARQQVQLVEAQIAALEQGRNGDPVIALGSTGSNRATARLLAAIARAPQGAVVLPGLDLTLDDASFAAIGGLGDAEPASSHPQAALRRLLPVLGVTRQDVRDLGRVPSDMIARQQFLSQALRPADTTDMWGRYLAAHCAEIPAALGNIDLIEAADECEEALALAIAMRGVLEQPGATAALVTPNRDLAARVRAELLRWQIVVDDSGGESLGTTPHGALARLALACAKSQHAAMDVIALLAHPLVQLGLPRLEVARLAPLVESGVLRAVLPSLGPQEAVEIVGAAHESAQHRHAHRARARISAEDWDAIETVFVSLATALQPLACLPPQTGLAAWVKAHRATILALTAGPGGAAPSGTADQETLADLLDELENTSDPAIALACEEYVSFFDTLAKQATVRGPQRAHPRLKILGLLEARLVGADVMLLAGLDETVWPPQASTDAFLNRTMRAKLGLSSPERRIGQTAHDFVAAMGCRDVIISRSAKRAGSPMVASRFLLRMAALAGPHWQDCQLRGAKWLGLARAIDAPTQLRRVPKPRPAPPLELRPDRLSVTEIETLRRDPYAIYAKHILMLVPLDPMGIEMGAREKGSILHEVLARFAIAHPKGDLPFSAANELTQMARAAMAPLLANARFRAFQWPQVEKSLQFYLIFEAARRGGMAQMWAEQPGKMTLPLDDGSIFTLTCTADRLELGRDGNITVVDYKSGAVPSLLEVEAGFAPQLTLEAAMVDNYSFAVLPEGSLATQALYLKLGGEDGGKEIALRFGETSFNDVVADHFDRLLGLLNQFRNQKTPYLPKPHVKFLNRFSPYDHLARVKEWSNAPGEEV